MLFSKNDGDICTIESFKLKLNVTDRKPAWNTYRAIPKQLYSEVKQYLEDLIANNWIKTSYSSCASPMVYVRTKTALCDFALITGNQTKKIMPGRMPIPRIQFFLENLGEHKYSSTLDMSKAKH